MGIGQLFVIFFHIVHRIIYYFVYVPFREVYCLFRPKARMAFCLTYKEYDLL